ncbi:uncharacterized protein LOC124152751 [Haliotis rufescens]|uniref:uncharacterized protein LOC124152751 n=1 Tax=Haliotis rufescens TaxID=6454 RepID=UPI001EAFD307|nr:uncharacterized protein LOC124152751 [Haliotis rufescens]
MFLSRKQHTKGITMNQSLTLAILLCLPCLISASCMAGRVKTRTNQRTGQQEKYCTYGSNTFGVNEYYFDASSCMNCTCSSYMMSCCGVGQSAGVMRVAPPCKVKKVGQCGVKIVRIDNEDIPC